MPLVLRIDRYCVFFWANEGEPLEPIHVHVAEGNPVPHAKELIRLLRGLPCRINLIRFHEGVEEVATTNKESRHFPASNEKQMEWLRAYLTANGITTTIRRSRGEDILAACGMLVNSLTSER